MSWKNYLRLGLIFAVTGIIVLGHYGLFTTGRLPRSTELIIGVVLVVVGLPLVVAGLLKHPRDTHTSEPPGT